MNGFFQDDQGNRSMSRLLAFMGFFLGGVVAIWSLAVGLATGVLAGTGLAAGGQVMKSIQKKFEK